VCSLITHLIQEMRQDRKIHLILKDKGIEEYINLDITGIDLDNDQD